MFIDTENKMFAKLAQKEMERMMKLYALLCSDQDASTEFLNTVGSGLGSKTDVELRDHYRRCFTDYLLRLEKKRRGHLKSSGCHFL